MPCLVVFSGAIECSECHVSPCSQRELFRVLCVFAFSEGNVESSVCHVWPCSQRELKQSELVLELMMAPLVCTFLACLLQLTTICAAWNIISDRQRRRPPHQAPQQLSTPV